MPKAKPAPNNFSALQYPQVLVAKPKTKAVPVYLVYERDFDKWFKSQPKATQSSLLAQGFKGGASHVSISYKDASIESVYVGVGSSISLYSFAYVVDQIMKSAAQETYDTEFSIDDNSLSIEDLEKACIGWSLAAYKFDAYKKNPKKYPRLVWPKGVDKKRVESFIQSISLIRNLINLPANDLGPEELADTARQVAVAQKATFKVIEDKKLLTSNFPMIYAVGDSSERRPRLIDITWGKTTDPKLTIVGKGVVFDTGGLDIKPSSAMLLMKKDMGGSAMALGLAWMIMSLNLPVRLRVLIPAVENSISGIAYRPGDVLRSRQGLTVEIGNTDAEGRLVMADCLTLACEEKPDLLMDFSTLTGAARTALGFDIPAMFSNNDEIAIELQKTSLNVEDPLWQLPLWAPYKNDISSSIADLNNAGNNPAGSITAALFLQSFVTNNTDWVHIDHYAWEASGKPGRPRGGADTGMRAAFAYLEKRYKKKSKK
ncbi:MAG: leucyl aminopeptidase [Micavibrio aeruginosavorus]|uniref:Leucyl aminopeptidase n=1 Tax=Micavibrio aeruginosavorus TaxID=349221 RepID=A0A2W5HCK2_9BACT|nr:MAG: leucyl aminopeptidase [Micavibrio aeruginosavorus]